MTRPATPTARPARRRPARPARTAGRLARLAAAGTLGALVLTACGGTPPLAGSAAIVGDRRITTADLAQLVESGLADPAASEAASDRPGYQRNVLTTLMQSDLVDIITRRRGITVTPGDVDERYAAFVQQAGGQDQLRQRAAAAGLSLDQVRAISRTQALTAALGDDLTKDVPVPASQIQQAYQTDIDRYDQVRVATIAQPSLAEAQALLPQATTLDDPSFQALARTRSTDAASRDAGGDLGLQSRSQLDAAGLGELATAAFAAKDGDTFAVAAPPGGRVVRVLARQTTSLQEATPQLRRTLLQEQQSAAVQDALTSAARDMKIVVNPRFGQWDPTSLSVVAASATGPHEVSSPEAPAGAGGDSSAPAAPQESPAPELVQPDPSAPAAPSDPAPAPSATPTP